MEKLAVSYGVKGQHALSPSRATALAHRCVVTHRIGLLSVTLRSDIVALLRKEKLNL